MEKFKILSNLCLLTSLLLSSLIIPVGLKGGMYWVANTNDSGPGSLRDAINWANTTAGHDTINFNIPGGGRQTISPLSQLPPLTDLAGVFMGGLSQPGATDGVSPPSSATLMIEINGISAGYSHGFWILSPNNTIQGLVINNFEKDGIRIQGIPGGGTFNNYIYCNFIGTDTLGFTPVGNGRAPVRFWAGVYILCTPDTIGFAFNNTVNANLISANYAEGVGISSCPPSDVFANIVTRNYIGTDINGILDFGNIHDGVYIGEGAHDNLVDTNLISGNDFEGVCIVGYAEQGWNSHSNTVWNNIIGLDINLNPLPNTMDGVSIGQYGNIYQGGFATDNVIDYNKIAYNGHDGISIWEHFFNTVNADRNHITMNSIYDNDSLGIDLDDDIVTFNDPADMDAGANEDVNYPVIDSAVHSAGNTTIYGSVDINTNPAFAIIEVFKAKQDPTNHGEGQIYLGSTNPDMFGNWNVLVTGLMPGDTVTATTTDTLFNTSEFCDNIIVYQSGIEDVPISFELAQNNPNPFSNFTTIQYAVPEISDVNLSIFDVSGRLIKVLANGRHSPSYYSIKWDGKDNRGERVSAGIYFYRLETDGFKDSKKLIFFR